MSTRLQASKALIAVRASVALALMVAGSCAHDAQPAQAPSEPPPSTGAETTAPAAAAAPEAALPEGLAFKDMSQEQRATFMKQKVMPEMKPIFQAFDAEHFAKFTCKTCHGTGPQTGNFTMPNADLPRLPVPEKFMAYAQDPKHAPWVKFMAEQVKPKMAQLLQLSEYNPATNSGEFSCHSCHLTDGEAAPSLTH